MGSKVQLPSTKLKSSPKETFKWNGRFFARGEVEGMFCLTSESMSIPGIGKLFWRDGHKLTSTPSRCSGGSEKLQGIGTSHYLLHLDMHIFYIQIHFITVYKYKVCKKSCQKKKQSYDVNDKGIPYCRSPMEWQVKCTSLPFLSLVLEAAYPWSIP